MRPVSCLTLLSCDELRQETIYLNWRLEQIPVQCDEWFKLARQDIQVSHEITRRRELFNRPVECSPWGRQEVDVSNLKRIDFTNRPNESLAREMENRANRIGKTVEDAGQSLCQNNIYALEDQASALAMSAIWLRKPEPNPKLKIVLELAVQEALKSESALKKCHNFRIVLNRRLSMFQTVLDRYNTLTKEKP